MSEFLTAGDAAKELQMSSMGIKAAAERGDLPVAAMTRGGLRLFTPKDVERFCERRAERELKRNGRSKS